MRTLTVVALTLALAACATPIPSTSPAGAGAAMPQVSPECLAARLRPADAMPASMIPDEVLRQARSGWVAVRYDVVDGRARNATVVASDPPGLYDAYVLRHARAYTEPTGATVRGCIMTTHVKF